MDVTLALLCDYANLSQDRKLNILGVFSVFNVTTLPALLPQMYVVVSTEAALTEAGQEFPFELVLWNADGREMLRLQQPLQFPPITHPGDTVSNNQIIGIARLQFPTAGDYSFIIRIANQERRRIRLRVNDRSDQYEVSGRMGCRQDGVFRLRRTSLSLRDNKRWHPYRIFFLGISKPPVGLQPIPVTHVQHEWQGPARRPWYQRLASEHTLVRYDNRGSGLSDRFNLDFSLDAQIRDLEAVLDHLQLEKVSLLAQFSSGPLGIAYASTHPDRVSHLILWHSWANGKAKLYPAHQQVVAWTGHWRDAWLTGSAENPRRLGHPPKGKHVSAAGPRAIRQEAVT